MTIWMLTVHMLSLSQTHWNRTHYPKGELDFCCELHVDGAVEATGCLRVQPRWMECLLPKIGHLAMNGLALPGTHQSGTFSKGLDWSSWYVTCQEENVLTQLLYGIRAFDLRPGAKKKSEEFMQIRQPSMKTIGFLDIL